MSVYDRQAKSALRLISKYGQGMTLKVVTKGVYDENTLSTGPATEKSYPVKGVVETYRMKEVDGSIIQQGDKKITLAASGLAVTPMPENFIIIGSETWKIVTNEPTAPGGIPVVHTVQIRK